MAVLQGGTVVEMISRGVASEIREIVGQQDNEVWISEEALRKVSTGVKRKTEQIGWKA